MKTTIVKTLGACLLTVLVASANAQTPSMPQVNTPSTQQAQQSINQVKQNTTQRAQQGTSQVQQTASAAGGSTASSMQKAEQEVTKMSSKVNNLSDDQKAKIKQVFVDYYTKRTQNKATAAGNADQLKQLNSAANKSKTDAIKDILSPDQLAAWKKKLSPGAAGTPATK